MPVLKISISEFIDLCASLPVLDVRSPSEYAHAHIPTAYSLPLFNDEERKIVGTTYKQDSREGAIKIGLDFFGPNMRKMVEEVEAYDDKQYAANKTMLVHCWRGGMRSAAVAWLLDLYGFKTYLLEGGYKVFRTWVLKQLALPYNLRIIGGYTGSGKTKVLHELKKRGQSIINLEHIAQHKGSAFGGLDKVPQPSVEMFENILALELYRLTQKDSHTIIWVEDESQRIGDVNMPTAFYKQLRTQPLYFLDIPFDKRLDYIVEDYGGYTQEGLINAIIRIQKRLGPLETKSCIQYLLEGQIKPCFDLLLKYYDKQYEKGLHKRNDLKDIMHKIPCVNVSAHNNTIHLLNKENEQRD